MGGYPHPSDTTPEMQAIYDAIRPATPEQIEDSLSALPEGQREIVEEYHGALKAFHANAIAAQAKTRRVHKPKSKD